MNPNKQEYLNAMGIEIWQQRHTEPEIELSEIPVKITQPPQTNNTSTGKIDWTSLQEQVKQCQLCSLCETRTQTVFGVGNQNTDILIIGEAPGANEDKQGEPFVGRAGQLLNQMLKSIGLQREDVFIANILKCRPPNNRDPQAEEVATCTPYLKQQIELLQPKVIVAVGRIAAQFLLNSKTSLGKLREQTHEYESIPLIVTYHPAYLLRSPSEKRKAYTDLIRIKSYK